MGIKDESKEVYKQGLIGYAAEKLINSNRTETRAHDTKSNTKGAPTQVENEDKIPSVESKIVISEKVDEFKEPSQTDILNEVESVVEDLEEISKEDNQKREHISKEGVSNDLLKDIEKNLENGDGIDEELPDEVSEIYKTNHKLQSFLTNLNFVENTDHIKIDNKYVSYISLYSGDALVEGDLSLQLTHNSGIGEFTMTCIYQPTSTKSIKKQLMRKRKTTEAERISQIERLGSMGVDPSLAYTVSELTEIIDGLTSNKIKLYNAFTIIRIVDEDLEKLRERISSLTVFVENMNYTLTKCLNIQASIHDMFGLGGSQDKFFDLLHSKRLPYILTTQRDLGRVNSFILKEDNNISGIPIGKNIWNNRMICRDFWSGLNYNTIFSGISGTGKSYTDKLVSLREYLYGIRQIIVDPDGEFEDLTQNIGGDYIKISPSADERNKINPFDFFTPRHLVKEVTKEEIMDNLEKYTDYLNDSFKRHVSDLKSLIAIIISSEKLSNDYYSDISYLLSKFFKEVGKIDENNITTFFELAKKPLNIRDFYEYLLKLSSETDKEIESNRLKKLSNGLFDYADRTGNYSDFLGTGKTSLDMQSSDWIAFGLKDIKGSGPMVVISFIIIAYIDKVFSKKDNPPIRLTVDEAYTLIGNNIDIASYLAVLYRRARKYNMGITLIVQGIDNLFTEFSSAEKRENFGSTFLQNANNIILLTQSASALDIIAEKLKPDEMEMNFLKDCLMRKENNQDVRGRAFVIAGGSKDQVQITPEPYIDKYINTDPRKKQG